MVLSFDGCGKFVFPALIVDIGLPVVAGFDVKAGEPAASSDISIDIDGVSQVERKVGSFLSGVAANHDLSGLMGKGGPKLFVDEGERVLLGDRNIVLEIGVNKNMALGFVIRLGVAQEIPVRFRNGSETVGRVGIEGGPAAPGFQPMGEIGLIDRGEEELFLVIAVKKGGVELFPEANEKLDHAFGIGTPVKVIANKDEVILGLRIDELDHPGEGIKAAVDVADGKGSHEAANGLAQDPSGVKS